MKLLLSEVLSAFARAVLLRGEEVVGVHLSTIPRLSATGWSSTLSVSFLQTWLFFSVPGGAVVWRAQPALVLICSEFLGKTPGQSVQRWVPSRSTRRDVNSSTEKERHDAIFRKVRG